jgi:hypothetical protein
MIGAAAAAIRLEARIVVAAIRFVLCGFRLRRPTGFSYDRKSDTSVMLLAFAALTVPEMLVLDLLLIHHPVARTISDVLHGYAIVWMLGIVASTRLQPHALDADTVTFRLGSFMSARVERANIVSLARRRFGEGGRAARRALRDDACILALPDAGELIECELREPVVVDRGLLAPRTVKRLFIEADEPAALINALRLAS